MGADEAGTTSDYYASTHVRLPQKVFGGSAADEENGFVDTDER